MAEIGQAELDKESGEPKADQVQEDNVEGDVNEAEVAAPMDQGSPVSSTPRDAQDPERLDISSRHSSPKSGIGEDDMEDESQDRRPRDQDRVLRPSCSEPTRSR